MEGVHLGPLPTRQFLLSEEQNRTQISCPVIQAWKRVCKKNTSILVLPDV